MENKKISEGLDSVVGYAKYVLPEKLTSEEEMRKIAEIKEKPNHKTREQIIFNNVDKVAELASSIGSRYNTNPEDLASYGYETLISSIDAFDPTKGVTYQQYIAPILNNQMLTGVAANLGIPRELIDEIVRSERDLGELYRDAHLEQGITPKIETDEEVEVIYEEPSSQSFIGPMPKIDNQTTQTPYGHEITGTNFRRL